MIKSSNWYHQKEAPGAFGFKIIAFFLNILPPFLMRVLAYPVGFAYFLFASGARGYSKAYLKRVSPEKKLSSAKHIISFALNMIENIQGWADKIPQDSVQTQNDDIESLLSDINCGKGVVLIVSHAGNSQLLRSFGMKKTDLITVADMKVTEQFNNFLSTVNPEARLSIIDADKIGPESILQIKEKLENGGIAVIAGDRKGAHSDRYITLPFLGKEAQFPYGSFLLSSLLDAPVYFMFGMRKKDLSPSSRYTLHIHKNNISFNCSRREREERITQTARNFCEVLEKHTVEHPYQWYNFYDFWA